jgi:hypothetical protein
MSLASQFLEKLDSIRDIDTTSDEGKLLLMTLGRLSCQRGYDTKNPDEILQEMQKISDEVFT